MTGTFLLDKLAPFTEYSFLLEACTQVGCTNSSSATAQTMEGGELVKWQDSCLKIAFVIAKAASCSWVPFTYVCIKVCREGTVAINC